MAFDAASVAALLSALIQRAEGQQFVFTTQSTAMLYVDHPRAPLIRPISSKRTLISWRAVYRSPSYFLAVTGPGGPEGRIVGLQEFAGVSRVFTGDSLVCDTAQLLRGEGELLLWAQYQFDLHDQRMHQGMMPPAKFP